MQECPWHRGEQAPKNLILGMTTDDGSRFYARGASKDRIEMGMELGNKLRDLAALVVRGPKAVKAAIPEKYAKWLKAHGHDPVDAWLDHQLADLVLNQGRMSAAFNAIIEQTDDLPDCEVCAFAVTNEGILCRCGHDWSCHPDAEDKTEPCSHCGCSSMQMVES
jgi:hypothetical protein